MKKFVVTDIQIVELEQKVAPVYFGHFMDMNSMMTGFQGCHVPQEPRMLYGISINPAPIQVDPPVQPLYGIIVDPGVPSSDGVQPPVNLLYGIVMDPDPPCNLEPPIQPLYGIIVDPGFDPGHVKPGDIIDVPDWMAHKPSFDWHGNHHHGHDLPKIDFHKFKFPANWR